MNQLPILKIIFLIPQASTFCYTRFWRTLWWCWGMSSSISAFI